MRPLWLVSLHLRSRATFGPDPLQQHAGGFVGGVLRHQFATEGFGEHGLVEMVDQPAGTGSVGCETVDPREKAALSRSLISSCSAGHGKHKFKSIQIGDCAIFQMPAVVFATCSILPPHSVRHSKRRRALTPIGPGPKHGRSGRTRRRIGKDVGASSSQQARPAQRSRPYFLG